MTENAAKDPSMIAEDAITPTTRGGRSIRVPGSTAARVEGRLNELKAENETLRAQLKDLRTPETKELTIQNEVLTAIIDGHLFKERITEVVKLVLFEELDNYLNKRFTQGTTHTHTQTTEAKHRLEYFTNKPEQNHDK